MRIVLVSAHFRPHVGGVETYSESLAEGLAARGHRVTVVCCRTDRSSPAVEEGPYRVVRVPSRTWPERRLDVPYPLPSPLRLAATLRRALREADVVHVQDVLYASSVAALLLARRAGVPSLVTQHVGFVPQGRRALDVLQRLALAAVGPVARRASRITAYNTEVAAWAEAHWRLEQVTVEPVGVRPPPELTQARSEFGFAPGRFVALFVGRDVQKKGLDLFLGAGDPAYDLVAVTDRAGPDERATLLPFMPPQRLSRLLSSVDAFVLPSEAEGIPLALQEAMTHGVPIVATYAPGYAGAFEATDIAAVTRDSDSVRTALRRLVADPSERARLATRSRAIGASSFSLKVFIDAHEALYRQLTAVPRLRE